MLGTYPEGGRVQWEDVSFAEADLRDAVAYGAVFKSCDFSNARLEEVNFNQCEFSHCRFAGTIEEVSFDGRSLPDRAPRAEMEDVDFTGAYFVNVDFRGYMLTGATLPNDPDVFPVRRFPCVARRVIDDLAGEESEPARILRGVLQNGLPHTDVTPESVWVFNRRDWRAWGGDELATLAETEMKRAEAECLA